MPAAHRPSAAHRYFTSPPKGDIRTLTKNLIAGIGLSMMGSGVTCYSVLASGEVTKYHCYAGAIASAAFAADQLYNTVIAYTPFEADGKDIVAAVAPIKYFWLPVRAQSPCLPPFCTQRS